MRVRVPGMQKNTRTERKTKFKSIELCICEGHSSVSHFSSSEDNDKPWDLHSSAWFLYSRKNNKHKREEQEKEVK